MFKIPSQAEKKKMWPAENRIKKIYMKNLNASADIEDAFLLGLFSVWPDLSFSVSVLYSHVEDDATWDRGKSAGEKRGEEEEQGELCTRLCRNIRHNLAGIKSYQKVCHFLQRNLVYFFN